MAEFGNTFRSARETRGLTIDEVAQETRISKRFLRAIEAEAFEELPGGVFNRGFIRTYANEVGIDAAAMVDAYGALTAEKPLKDSPQTLPPSEIGRERFVLPIAIGGLAVVVFLFSIASRNGSSPTGESGPTASETAAPADPVPATAESVDSIEPQSLPDQEETGVVANEDTLPSEATEVLEETTAAVTEASLDEDTIAAPSAEVTPPPVQGVALTETDSLPLVANNEPISEGFNVRVEVLNRTRISVELDGLVLYEDVAINPPFWRLYTVNEALALTIADPSAVSLSIDGESVSQLGSSNEAWAGTITRDNIALLTQP